MRDADFRAAAWAWADHLRAGGTTPWSRWAARPATHPPADARGPVPGAAELELVRRLAERRAAAARRRAGDRGQVGPDDALFAELVDRALARSGPGRGPTHIPLPWPDDTESRSGIGSPPLDPADVSADELARVGAGLLADLLATAPAPEQPASANPTGPTARVPRRRPWHPAFHVAGPPVSAAVVRRSLALDGHVEGGRSPEVVLMAEPLDVALAQVWSTRVQRGAAVRWVTFARRWASRDELPPAADLARIAAWWAERVGPERVHVVTGPDRMRGVNEALGLKPRPAPRGGAWAPPSDQDPRSLTPASVDVLRRVNGVLSVRLPDDDRRPRLQWLGGRLPTDANPRLAVPEAARDWVDGRSARLTADLAAGGYAVHGDLGRLAPRHAGAAHPRNAEVLDLVLSVVLDVALQLRRREDAAR